MTARKPRRTAGSTAAAPKPPRQGGRPAYEPTPKDREQVKTMSGLGIRTNEIAAVLGISEPTLRKYFASELDMGHVKANAAVAQSLYRMATDKLKPSAAAAIFWLKTRAGWKEGEGGPYVVPPADPAPEKLGKKAQAQADASTAARGTGWDDLLPRPGIPLQ